MRNPPLRLDNPLLGLKNFVNRLRLAVAELQQEFPVRFQKRSGLRGK
jgi:hypothetical protein